MLAVHTGTQVRFPNSDNIRHQVYSFSTANLPDYRLDVAGLALTYDNRVEVSFARQRFDLGSLVHKLNLPEDNLGSSASGASTSSGCATN